MLTWLQPISRRPCHRPAHPHAHAQQLVNPASKQALLLCIATLFVLTGFTAKGQATRATASRRADLQVGGYYGFSVGQSADTAAYKGPGGYVTFDFKPYLGVELNIHQVNGPNLQLYQRTYELGARYVKHYGIVSPYLRGSYGRGVFNYANGSANLAYNLFAVGAGADFRVRDHINMRGDFDYQRWQNFIGSDLAPGLLNIGVAYHF